MYEVADFINMIVERIVITFELFWLGVGSVHYSLGECIYDIRELWS